MTRSRDVLVNTDNMSTAYLSNSVSQCILYTYVFIYSANKCTILRTYTLYVEQWELSQLQMGSVPKVKKRT